MALETELVATPVLHLIVGPNGAGKTTLLEKILFPSTGLPFINADVIAKARWPEDTATHSYEAAKIAGQLRSRAIKGRMSFVAETVFSHPSKLEILQMAGATGYRRYLHVILIPEELAVARVEVRVETGGHEVPEEKIRGRFHRLWPLVRQAIGLADESVIYDNSLARRPFRIIARYDRGRLLGNANWPAWTPDGLVDHS